MNFYYFVKLNGILLGTNEVVSLFDLKDLINSIEFDWINRNSLSSVSGNLDDISQLLTHR